MKENDKSAFKNLILNKTKFNLFLLRKVPMAFLAGIRVAEFDERRAVVKIRYKYLNKNPFNSIYFACLAMAAELSTGILAMLNTYNSNPKVSLIVVGLEANFIKKAVGKISFQCLYGEEFDKAVKESINSGQPVLVRAESIGHDEKGDQVAQFFITWSFKSKS